LRHAEYPGPTRQFPIIRVVEQDHDYVKLRIGDHSYYWPSGAKWSGLEWMHQEVFVPSSRNSHTYEFAGVKIRPGDQVVDAGASEGFFTRYALQRGATVLAVEPVPSLANALEKTFAAEIGRDQVRVLPAALGVISGQANLELVPERLYESHLASTGTEMQMVSLDDIAGQERVDFVKMDIEGAEIDAVLGGKRAIAMQKPRLTIAVYHQLENARRVCQLLHEIRPDYQIMQRGIYAWEGCEPRPMMVYAW
jgi:FkbM family methyltransferase